MPSGVFGYSTPISISATIIYYKINNVKFFAVLFSSLQWFAVYYIMLTTLSGGIFLFEKSVGIEKSELLLLFLRCFFFFSCIYTACAFYDAWTLRFYSSVQFRYAKYFVSFFLPFLSCFFLLKKEKSLKFVNFVLLAVQTVNAVVFAFDKLGANKITGIGMAAYSSKVLYVNLCVFGVFSAVFLFRAIYKNVDFFSFYNSFFKTYSITLIFNFLMIFILSRFEIGIYSANFLLFTGEIKDFFTNIFTTKDLNAFLRTIGNILLFAPFSMMILAFYKGEKPKYAVLYTFLLSLFIEVGQFIFKNGEPEADDLFLNTLGGLIGVLIFEKVIKQMYFKDRNDNTKLKFNTVK